MRRIRVFLGWLVRTGAFIRNILRKLVNQISVRSMNLHPVEPRLNRTLRCLLIIPHNFPNLLLGQLPRHIPPLDRNRASRRKPILPRWSFCIQHILLRRPTRCPELAIDETPPGVHGVGDTFPCGDLCGSVNSGDIGVARCAGGDECCFGDEEGAWGGGALGVVFYC